MSEADDLTLQSEDDILGKLIGIVSDIEAKENMIYVGVGLQDCQIQPKAGQAKIKQNKRPFG